MTDFWALSSTFKKKFFDLSTPSMRNVDDGENKTEKENRENNVVYSCQQTARTPTACAKNLLLMVKWDFIKASTL